MAAMEIVSDLVGGALRVGARLLFEIIVELLIQGTGHVLLRLLRSPLHEDERSCLLLGMAVWALAALVAVLLLR